MPPVLSPQFLEDKKRLDAWRETRPKRSPIPAHLWKRAVSHVQQYGLNRVSREFRVNYTQLKRKAQAFDSTLAEQPPAEPSFVELPWPQGMPAQREQSVRLRLLLERPDGSRLSVEGGQPDPEFLDGLIRSFYSR